MVVCGSVAGKKNSISEKVSIFFPRWQRGHPPEAMYKSYVVPKKKQKYFR
jgi:hypothetical protein